MFPREQSNWSRRDRCRGVAATAVSIPICFLSASGEAARRCEAVLFLISKAWLASRWCTNERRSQLAGDGQRDRELLMVAVKAHPDRAWQLGFTLPMTLD